jgi:maltooligosyltrehalose trehalohydrolase
LGDRLSTQAEEAALAAALAITLLAPMPPLLFMGDEWGSTKPFPFFCDFQGDLAQAVRKGRREEFKSAYAEIGDEIPDPLAEETFRSAVLDWQACATTPGQKWLRLVRDLLTTRSREIVPRLATAAFGSAQCLGNLLSADWRLGDGDLSLLANLSDRETARPGGAGGGRPIWGGPLPEMLAPWSVFWGIGER